MEAPEEPQESPSAWVEDARPPVEEVEAVGFRGRDADQRVGTGTVLSVPPLPPPGQDLGDLLRVVPGAAIRRLGGLGSWTGVSLRGSSSRQVAVLLDGIPLNPDGSAAADLSELPLLGLAQVEVWRTLPPVGLGSSGLGGVVNLVSRPSAGMMAEVTGGNWGTARLRAAGGLAGRDAEAALFFDGLSTRGDFQWLDTGGSAYTVLDDRLWPRWNNDARQATGLGRAQAEVGRWTLLGLAQLGRREQGLPGVDYDPLLAARYGLARDVGSVEARHRVNEEEVSLRLAGFDRRERVDDPQRELGLSEGPTQTRLRSGGLQATGMAQHQRWSGEGAVEARLDDWQVSTTEVAGSPRRVLSAAAGGAHQAGAWRGAAQVGWLALGDAEEALRSFGVGGVGAQVLVGRCRLEASASRGVRPPDLTERFGSTGLVQGNPSLRPEQGTTWEVGAQVGLERGLSSRFEAAAFQRDLRDAITWQRNAQGVAQAINLPLAQVRGLEAGWRAVAASGSQLSLQGTLLDARAATLRLPGVPVAEGSAAFGQSLGPWRVGVDLWLASRTWRDRANLVVDPGRSLVGAQLGWEREGWSTTWSVRNLLGQTGAAVPANPLDPRGPETVVPLADYLGFPLPGRTWLWSVAWRPAPPPRDPAWRSPKGTKG